MDCYQSLFRYTSSSHINNLYAALSTTTGVLPWRISSLPFTNTVHGPSLLAIRYHAWRVYCAVNGYTSLRRGGIQRYKARWIVRDFDQRYGIDVNEAFAAVV
jgi:hypothetical protein